jgi:hypothetical protein
MPLIMPVQPSIARQRLDDTPINGRTYNVLLRWNTRDRDGGNDGAWYMDVRESDNTPIAIGLKLVLGRYIGRYVNHPLFRDGVFVVDDTTGKHTETRFDDFGKRVLLLYFTASEAAAAIAALRDPTAQKVLR